MDLAQARGFLDQFDGDTRVRLVEAGQRDITEWTERLITAWTDGDLDAQHRARHSLRGLCENFGAHTLMTRCERNLSDPLEVATLREYRQLTLQLLGEIAHL